MPERRAWPESCIHYVSEHDHHFYSCEGCRRYIEGLIRAGNALRGEPNDSPELHLRCNERQRAD